MAPDSGRQVLVIIIVVSRTAVHAELLDLARQRVAAPTEQLGGITLAAAAVFQRYLYHALLEDRRGLLQDAGMAEAQFLVCPVLEVLDPVACHRVVPGRLQELLRQVVDEDFTSGGHYRDPAAEVLQLA